MSSPDSAILTSRSFLKFLLIVQLSIGILLITGCSGDQQISQDGSDVSTSIHGLPLYDDFGFEIETNPAVPARIVSLSPVFTEILFAIGKGELLKGRTSWDDYPTEALSVKDVGAGIRPNVEVILEQNPDIVFLYASDDNRAAADALIRAGVKTMAIRTVTIADFFRTVRLLGHMTGAKDQAEIVVDSISATLDKVRVSTSTVRRPSVVWPSWESPVMVVADGSFEAELIEIAGAENVFSDRAEAVATVTLEEIAFRNPVLIIAGAERRKRLLANSNWQSIEAIRDDRIVVLDTAFAARPGVRIGMAAVSLARALHPGIVE